MNQTMKYLCENIQGCVFGYTQSDEITLILIDYKTGYTQSWFNYNVQKICSVTASMATMIFNKTFRELTASLKPSNTLYISKYDKAMFDSIAFNVPKEDVSNNLIWRQLYAVRSSVYQIGQIYFSSLELRNKSIDDIRDMLLNQKGVDWNSFYPSLKWGCCCIKTKIGNSSTKLKWRIDKNIPIFSQDRNYIESRVY